VKAHRTGDIVFWLIDHTAGEAIVGYDAKDENTLIVAVGSRITEIDESCCSPTGRSEPPIRASYRRTYMKLHLGKLRA
jgi:hypothetical protein